ncbi:MAG TPA: hypothetical protein VIM81_13490 [Gammaproteobacteria bacterium]
MQILEMLFVLAILTIIFGSIFGFPLALTRMKQRGREKEAIDQSVRDEMSARLAELEDRVKVLERIVTDERSELHRQFREL